MHTQGHRKMSNKNKNHVCPCCGFLTLSEPPPGTFEICPVCYWEDDDVQFNDPNYTGGANQDSLNQARQNFKKFGTSSMKYFGEVRKPYPNEVP